MVFVGHSRPNGFFAGSLVSIFTVRINSKSFPWDVGSVQERHLPKFSATSDVRYFVVLVWPIANDIIKQKHTELETKNK